MILIILNVICPAIIFFVALTPAPTVISVVALAFQAGAFAALVLDKPWKEPSV